MLFNTDGIGSYFIGKECWREEMISRVNVFPISKRAAGYTFDINSAQNADVFVLPGKTLLLIKFCSISLY